MSKKKKKLAQNPGLNKKTLRRLLIDVFEDNANVPLNYKQLAKMLDITDPNVRAMINEVCLELVGEGKAEQPEVGKFKYIAPVRRTSDGAIAGRIEFNSRGKASFVSPDFEGEIFIAAESLNHALPGDEVKVYMFAKRKKRLPEGEVVEIIKRARETFVGVVEISRNFAFMISEHRSMPYDIFIPLENLKGAVNGQKVIVKIVDWPKKGKNPVGQVVEVLGNPGENETEMHAILAEFELPYHFPKHVEAAAEKIDETITAEEIARRRDFRDILTFTIDPIDAKDFDDALSLRKLENGHWEVGVHIADVTHYVEADSALDKEALERATSVYLVDRVVAMLPERLSNFICSLRPNEDKLTYSVVFEMDEEGEIFDKWYGRTIINSNYRFHYDEVQKIIETQEGIYLEPILTLNALARKLRAARFTKGSIAFDRIEVKFRIDENGKPLEVYFKESKEAHQLIEEFMLLANRSVAEWVGAQKVGRSAKTFVYRVHDEPDMEKLSNFASYIKRWGYGINMKSTHTIASSINTLLDGIDGRPEEDVISNLAIRAMAKAEYSTENIGHYGLAFRHYTHFTSPIRRYPDMMVHRLLTRYLEKGKSAQKKIWEDKCRHSSDMERKAAMAERASIKYKQAEYMKERIGQTFEGLISGITDWGVYVEIIENRIEGMIPIQVLNDDYYIYDEKNLQLTGKYSGKKFQLGDKITVIVAKVNIPKKQIDFNLATNTPKP